MAGDSSLFIPRRAVDVFGDNRSQSLLLEHWRGAAAYVLLAEPGAGKSEAFNSEARETGGSYVSARDFITLRSRTFESGLPIFIDGLDEIRAGTVSHRAPMDEIRRRLDELGRPAFRLSCREADWRSAVDRESLKAVAPDGKLPELHLQDLNDAEILALLKDLGVVDTESFVRESAIHGVRPLLGIPLLLRLMVHAVNIGNGQWPDNRSDIYRKACLGLATEHNEQHRAERRRDHPGPDRILDDAGLICALYLLAGTEDPPMASTSLADGTVFPDGLPSVLGITDPRAALDSKIFITAGQSRIPRHRTIAEFLAANAIAKRIKNGLPVTRVLALMSGADGGIVDPLRGLNAWLATCCEPERSVLINRDPLGVVLYGDLKMFTASDKKEVLHALDREAQRYPWFRKGKWEADPFGALATPDMIATFREFILSADRTLSHQSLLGCVFDAIEHGAAMLDLAAETMAIVLDSSFTPGTRRAALDAWLAQPAQNMVVAQCLMDDIKRGAISDPDDELIGQLLVALYPKWVTPRGVVKHFHPPKAPSLYGQYQDFWRRRLVRATPPIQLAELMDAWAEAHHPDDGAEFTLTGNHISGELLAAALNAHGDSTSTQVLYDWLRVGVGQHGLTRLRTDDAAGARNWLSSRPEKLKALVAYGWTQVRIDSTGEPRRFWESEERVLKASRPADWYTWVLAHAAIADDTDLARYCFDNAAHAAINPRPEFQIGMETVEQWVAAHRLKWPQAEQWLSEAWSQPMNNWQREEYARNRKYRASKDTARELRRRNIISHLDSIFQGSAPAGLMNQIALAYDSRFSDIEGATPAERVQDFLGGAIEEAGMAIDSLELTLTRSDLPNVDAILATELAGRSHFIRPACLLGASLAFARDARVVFSWSDTLLCTLTAFWLTESLAEQPGWYVKAAAARPAIIAPVLERYALQALRRRSVTHIAGLWPLAREEGFSALARLVIAPLLRGFPVRANERQLRILNHDLLPAATRSLPAVLIISILAERLALKSLDVGQRIAYLVAGLTFEGDLYSKDLLELVGSSQSRAAHVGRALEAQGKQVWDALPASAQVIGRLIELIAPLASPEFPAGAFWVGDAENIRTMADQLIHRIAAIPATDAANEIARLIKLAALKRWKPRLEHAAFDQTRATRDAAFKPASIDEVAKVLANKSPANSQDLAALFLDHLHNIEQRLHGSDTNGLRLFRRDDRQTPKIENDCRDILLERMRPPLLELGVHIEKEAQAAHDTRADMRLEFVEPGKRIVVPLEIKKYDDHQLWSAWNKQLRTYALDPAAGGVCIYLVMWFGLKARASPQGIKPNSPQHLKSLLSAMIPQQDKFRLHVAVLDLSLSP